MLELHKRIYNFGGNHTSLEGVLIARQAILCEHFSSAESKFAQCIVQACAIKNTVNSHTLTDSREMTQK